MADALLIGGGGSTAVASEHLLVSLERLRRSSVTCATAARRLDPLTAATPGDRWNGTGAELAQAAAALGRESEALELLGGALRTAVDGYGWAESRARSWLEGAIAPVASTVGFLAGRLGLSLLPSVLPVVALAAGAWMLLPASSRDSLSRSSTAGVERFAGTLLDSPATTEALRLLATSVDDAVLGALGVPPAMLAAYRASGSGSVARTAGAVLGVGLLSGDRGRAPAAVARAAPPVAVAAPLGIADRVARIPDSAQPVRIERYPAPGGDRFEVYIAGTAGSAADGSPLVEGGEHPWDMSSNIALIAEHDSSSLQAVRQALADAGAGPTSPVVFTGYSQGAAIATLMAESGEYATSGLVTVGAPTGGIPVTGDYPAVVVAHDDDPVTALGGPQEITNAVVVTAPRGEGWREGDPVLAGHAIDAYRETAARVDASGAPLLSETIARLPDGRDGATGDALSYTARRLSGCDPRSGAGGLR
ncbi:MULTISPECIES: hypothetical protein [unclassified Microcella]|uniref:hypothetical protein n=1 Tax=unclassified Microcella TaxID=2630066 RepID=UPI0006FCF0B3|nr:MULTISPECIES: hypothetical protein [unclassified Microcella]KQV25890.1 hypothetical protein ASC54_02665 [Yonghaparkia sp. Root332]KRF33301.1 hypothetical protein ASG83_04965 [Yonghaparkia sp. Soil809]